MNSLCPAPVTACARYEHRHCSVCHGVLHAIGGGGDDGRKVGGYEDEHDQDARICSACGDDFFLVCSTCAALDGRCAECRAEA